jgi:hypothetical protein
MYENLCFLSFSDGGFVKYVDFGHSELEVKKCELNWSNIGSTCTTKPAK